MERFPIVPMLIPRFHNPFFLHIILYLCCYCIVSIFIINEAIAQNEYLSLDVNGGITFWSEQFQVNAPKSVSVNTPIQLTTQSFAFGQFFSLGTKANLFSNTSLSLSFHGNRMLFSSDGKESTIVAVDGRPTEAIIRHDFQTELYSFSIVPSVSQKFSNVMLALEFPYTIPFFSRYTQNQTVEQPESLKGSQLSNEESKGKANDVFSNFWSLGIAMSYTLPISSMENLKLVPSISARKAIQSPFSASTVLPFVFNVAVGVQYSFTKNSIIEQKRDTVYTKNDTLLVLGGIRSADTVMFIEQKIDSVRDFVLDNISIKRTFCHNVYKHSVPKKSSVLTGEIKASFLDDSGKIFDAVHLVELYDVALCNVWVKEKNIASLPYSITSRSVVKKYKKEKVLQYTFSDSIHRIYPSTIRLQHTAVSEAGLESWKIRLERNNTLIMETKGYNTINEFTDIDINTLNLDDRFGMEFQCYLILKDYEGNEFVSQKTNIKLRITSNASSNEADSIEIHYVDPQIKKQELSNLLSGEVIPYLGSNHTSVSSVGKVPQAISDLRRKLWSRRFPELKNYLFSLHNLR